MHTHRSVHTHVRTKCTHIRTSARRDAAAYVPPECNNFHFSSRSVTCVRRRTFHYAPCPRAVSRRRRRPHATIRVVRSSARPPAGTSNLRPCVCVCVCDLRARHSLARVTRHNAIVVRGHCTCQFRFSFTANTQPTTVHAGAPAASAGDVVVHVRDDHRSYRQRLSINRVKDKKKITIFFFISSVLSAGFRVRVRVGCFFRECDF